MAVTPGRAVADARAPSPGPAPGETIAPRRRWPHVFLLVVGILVGVAAELHWWAAIGWFGPLRGLAPLRSLVIAAGAGAAAVFALRAMVRWVVRQLPLSPGVRSDYRAYDSLTYASFLLLFLGAVGIQLSIPLLYALGLLFVAGQVALIVTLSRRDHARDSLLLSPAWPSALFLLSGMAALIYQIVWQRVLFAAYGLNIESVTIIVSLFMFGLGIGALVGGVLSAKLPARSLELFVVCEAAIGGFGVVSLPLINWVAAATVHGSLLTISAATYALLCVPTVFMGATLPILVSYLHRQTGHIGRSVGVLYCLNTLGSAIAAVLTVDVLFRLLGQHQTVLVAAAVNGLVAVLVFRYGRALARHTAGATLPRDDGGGEAEAPRYALSYPVALLLAAAVGYVSLSQEIIWVRAISYASGGIPQVFGHVLGFFLLGVAMGALLGKEVCARNRIHPLAFIAGMLLTTAVVYYLSIPLASRVIAVSWSLGMLVSYLLVAVVAFLLGGMLPVLAHFATRPGTPVGTSLSHIYMANIAGSTAGPLVTGFVLLDRWTLQQNILSLSLCCLVLAGATALGVPSRRIRLAAAGAAAAAALLVTAAYPPLFRRVLERLHFHKELLTQPDFKYTVQNRSGIIAVAPDKDGDIIYGGGVYDGRFNLDPVLDSNGIRRAYMIAALHPAPPDVLEIGLSSGSWTWVVAAHRRVRHLTVVEINPGYFSLIEQYPDHRGILADPRIRYQIDDGRRWLTRHPDQKFDVILMNMTYHWRSNATSLLSREFLELCQAHLKEGGVMFFNPTGSEDVLRTAAAVFRYVTEYGFVAASDRPFAMTLDQRRENLRGFEAEGRPVLDGGNPVTAALLEELAGSDLHDMGDELRGRRDLRIVTDDNMLPEFKTVSSKIGRYYHWYNGDHAWTRFRF
jgi:spermidine synthase